MTTIDLPDRIEIEGFVLRQPTEDDVDAITAACQDPEIARWTRVPAPYTRADAQQYVAGLATARPGQHHPYLIVDPETGELVGSTGLHGLDPSGRTAEIGYWLSASVRGRGLATRVVRTLATLGIEAGLARITAHVLVGNEASCRVLERAGFSKEGTLRSLPADGVGVGLDRVDMHLYSLIVADLA